MFAYLCADPALFEGIRQEGLDLTEETCDRFVYDLAEVERSCTERILVTNRDRIDEARASGQDHATRLGPEDFLNLHPYAPPRRVEAAGGVIIRPGNPEPDVLLIFRRGRWDLPKGKRDPGETIEQCALREVREELGIRRVRVEARLGKTVHGYDERGRFRVKTTYWFLMRTPEARFVPQAEEDIEQVVWTRYSEAIKVLGFKTLRDHLQRYRAFILEYVDV